MTINKGLPVGDEIRKSFEYRIDKYLKDQIDWIERGRPRPPGSPDLFPLLRICLGRVLTNLAVRHESFTLAVVEASSDDTRHIYDWLLASHLRCESWLSRLDEQGRPLKLMKFGTVMSIVAEANKAMAKRRSDGFRVSASAGTQIVHECGGGWTIVRLTTPEALDYEGSQMGHCVGQGGYDHLIDEDPIYSLRDPMGRSHITIEVDNYSKDIRQLKGKQNQAPKIAYTRRLVGWPGLAGLTITEGECPAGFGVDRRFGLVELGALKPGESFEGDLWIVWNDKLDNPLVLPPNITIKGDVALRRAWRHSQYARDRRATPLPDGLTVEGKIEIEGMLVDGFNVKADAVVIENSHIKRLGTVQARRLAITDSVFDEEALSSAVLHGEIRIKACRGVTFTETTSLAGSVSIVECKAGLSPSPVVWFRDGFRLKGRGELSVDGSFVGFGHEVSVDGHLSITKNSTVSMPYCLDVSGNMIVSDSELSHWPEVLNVRGLTAEKSVQVIDRRLPPSAPTLGSAA
ncbi:hypothetical protein HFO56_01575 [Rhizobium laguerreae]|uniref:PcfJ domain-containing protein n=1 Tax=Rhizobium laguerreae TaxID=1076926 RepID=UPI001C8FCAD9|nr:PcfJ domain-containing protein [Rhizobium laguerreae]MBY3151100.1 hypothetical protein [Rhizobium laguerreae]